MNRHPNTVSPPAGLRNPALGAVARGTLLAVIVSLALLFLASVVLHWTALPEKTSPYLVFAISLAAILCGSRLTGRRLGYRGWLHGGLVGLLYVTLLVVASALFMPDFAFGFPVIVKAFLGFVFGAAGGMWGVNL